MSNTDELVERLRRCTVLQFAQFDRSTRVNIPSRFQRVPDPDCLEAAALIEQQRDEIARLRGALEPIAGCANLNDGSWYFMTPSWPMLKAARRALEGTAPAGLDRQGPRNDAG